jgi:hypothetical protein
MSTRFLTCLAAAALACAAADRDAAAWPAITREARPWSYWWWMGSAVDAPNLTRELERYRAAGWGGVHIIPIYGARGYEARYLEYLSPAWMAMLAHTIREAERLDMGVDMTLGTGWCFGGPNIGPEHANLVVVPRRTREGGYEIGVRQTMRVKRAAPGGEGWMLNPLYGAAIRAYLPRFTAAFAAYAGPRPRAFYHDSFEYNANWSPDLPAEFERRRGYRLQDEYPALFGSGPADRVSRVKSDYRETLSDLLAEYFTPAWTGWAHQHGARARNQAHGSPANLLDLYAQADIPETEMFREDRSTLIAKLASSAAHIMGRKLLAAESGTWLAEHFQETFADLKDLLTQLLLAGVNHVFYHGTCYSPDDAPWPGWLFYASTQMNPRNPIWRDAPAFNEWLARSQAMLQAGAADPDFLLYWPVYDVWQQPEGLEMKFTVHSRAWLDEQPFGRFARELYGRGWSFDFVSDRLLAQVSAAADGALRTPGARYAAILIPACQRMPVETMARLLSLADSGATVVFDSALPEDVPGLGHLESRRAALRKLTGSLAFRDTPAGGVRMAPRGAGRVLLGPAEAALAYAGLRRETLTGHPGLEFLRRARGKTREYFLANRGRQTVDGWTPLARGGRQAILMDPLTGETGEAALRRRADGGAEVYVRLEPGESVFVRLRPDRAPGVPPWRYRRPGVREVRLRGTWQVEFVAGGPELPPSARLADPAFWTEFAGEAGQRFGGTARYTIEFDAPPGEWFLDLGTVRESARVRLNGRELGTLFAPPYRRYAGRLEPKANRLEIEVTGLAANRIRDLDRRKVVWRVFHDINLVNQRYQPFDASGWPVRESGLAGPVRLREAVAVQPGRVR